MYNPVYILNPGICPYCNGQIVGISQNNCSVNFLELNNEAIMYLKCICCGRKNKIRWNIATNTAFPWISINTDLDLFFNKK